MTGAVQQWLVGLPTFAAILAVAGGLAAVANGTLWLVGRWVPAERRRRHNEITGMVLEASGTLYAVLLSFVAIAVWEDFKRADAIVRSEANLVGNLYRATIGLAPDQAEDIRHKLFVYAEIVAGDEWPGMMRGERDAAAGWQLLDRVHLALVTMRDAAHGSAAVETEILARLNDLYDARRDRFDAASASLPPVLWWNLIAGGVIVLGLCVMLGCESRRVHVLLTTALSASIGLVLALIVLLDAPFRGINHVSDAPFAALVRTVGAHDFPGADLPTTPRAVPPPPHVTD
ncbi:DUF4239 domain-containing protein [Zavarzinia compransoris]|uniref:bestrophin-like domain n=1 Tax=Zavarzinia marina TaxID=2911065 RepID=UPI001F46B851|nr:DUF4239 domain-containing protein [Zavarzinia marina]MCF4167080.1 DUF4239 domain-containing protein [Zavarzinia marina]